MKLHWKAYKVEKEGDSISRTNKFLLKQTALLNLIRIRNGIRNPKMVIHRLKEIIETRKK